MTDTTEAREIDHRLQWEPPARPDWVQAVNQEGYCMDIRGIVPLDERSLLDTTMRNTGLDDFGPDDWREPFQIYIKALEEEAELNLVGRLRTRSDLLILLEAKLQIEETYKQHPEINDELIVEPIIIVGQGRSGTSLLQNVLATHPDNGTLMHWEMMFPCPPPESSTYRTDPRIAKANKLVDQWNRVTPTFPSMHELGGDVPYEDSAMMAINFMAPTWLDTFGQVPSYDAYIFAQDTGPAFHWHQRVLKLLQWKNPRKRWILKDPMHLDRIADLLKVYPDAKFVWPHRDPTRALASLVSIIGTIHWGRSDHPFNGASLDYMTDPNISAGRFAAVINQIETGVIPTNQIYNVLYKDLVGDVLGTVADMYRHFGIELTEEGSSAMSQYMIDNPRDSRPAHRFNFGSPDVVARARQALKSYQDYFGIPIE
jgi:Sulfotransferase family